MHAQRDRLAHRRAVVRRVEPLLVQAVADLVEDAEKRVAELSWSSYRVVIRQSPGPMPVQNGWAVTSSRPRSKSKPTAAATASPKTCWRSRG